MNQHGSSMFHLAYLATLLLQSVMWIITEAVPVPYSNCANARDRSQEYLHSKWAQLQSGVMHESYLMTPTYEAMIKEKLTSTGNETYYTGNRECVIDSSASLEGRSLCPWYWNFSYDADRYPDILAEARCACNNCGNGTFLQCHRVNYNVMVLRKNLTSCDTEGYFNYESAYQPVAVGCACSLPETA